MSMSNIPRSPRTQSIDEKFGSHALDTISDAPLFPLNFPELAQLSKIFLKASLPATLATLSTTINGVICLKFVGDPNDPYKLAGASLATTWISATCIGIIFSLNLGFSVVGAQAFGARQYRRLGVLYQRNLFVLTLIGLPLILSLLFAEPFLNWMGLDPHICTNLGLYMRCLIPSIIGVIILESTKTFLMAQNIFHVGATIQISTAFLNYFWCYMMTQVFDLSIQGVGIAKSITDLTGAVAIVLYCKYSGSCNETWIPWDREAVQEWIPYLKQVVTIGGVLYVEWISIELSMFIVGALNDEYVLGAYGLFFSLVSVLFTPCIANMIAIETYVGNAVGAGFKNKAQKITFVAFVINGIYVGTNLILCLGFNSQVALYFTQDSVTAGYLTNILFLYGLYHAADSYASHIGAVLRTIGQEKQVMKRFMICYFLIANNLEWITGLALGFGYVGVMLSMGVGMYIMFIWSVIEMKNFDWDVAIKEVRAELGHKNSKAHEGEYVEMIEV